MAKRHLREASQIMAKLHPSTSQTLQQAARDEPQRSLPDQGDQQIHQRNLVHFYILPPQRQPPL